MADKPHYTAAQVIRAVRHTRGMLILAAEHLGCTPHTLYNYQRRYASVRDAIAQERERTTDIAELKLYQAIHDGQAWAIALYLKTQGRSRGYGESPPAPPLPPPTQHYEGIPDAGVLVVPDIAALADWEQAARTFYAPRQLGHGNGQAGA
jgi:hypothetical protein